MSGLTKKQPYVWRVIGVGWSHSSTAQAFFGLSHAWQNVLFAFKWPKVGSAVGPDSNQVSPALDMLFSFWYNETSQLPV